MNSKVIQLYMCVCVCILFQDFSMIGCYKILTIVPCAVQYILAAYFIDSSAIDTS